ncbi:ROK family protein [Actinopolymorpha alba]|uniref:ROK family protein n=1 Tax=Actinopolymorpha alba TaxID=533267 RepID=UPI0012F67AB1|nr:ROK family protein [Actinopolymorpha alba]
MTSSPDARTKLVPVMDIGGTHVTAGLFEPDAQGILDGSRQRLPLDASAPAAAIVERIVRCGDALDAPSGMAWGIALPGPFDYERGIGWYEGVGKFDALHGVELGRALRDGLRAAPARTRFLNDANAFALGEWASGAAVGQARVLALTLGTGIGSAFVAHGRIVEDGPEVPPEGRADLLTIDGRPLEETVSRRAVLARYATLAGGGTRPEPAVGVDVEDIARRAEQGDAVAANVLGAAFHALGAALRPWVERFGATLLVVGGSMAKSWDLVAAPLRSGLGGPVGPAVVPARHGDDATLIGAGIHALR